MVNMQTTQQHEDCLWNNVKWKKMYIKSYCDCNYVNMFLHIDKNWKGKMYK